MKGDLRHCFLGGRHPKNSNDKDKILKRSMSNLLIDPNLFDESSKKIETSFLSMPEKPLTFNEFKEAFQSPLTQFVATPPPLPRTFPTNFNPRKEANMPHKEKVSHWVVNVPIYPSSTENVWYNDCYNALDPMTDQIEDSSFPNFDMSNSNDIIELQSRMITLLSNKIYQQEPEKPRDPNLQMKSPSYNSSGMTAPVVSNGTDQFLNPHSLFRMPMNELNYTTK